MRVRLVMTGVLMMAALAGCGQKTISGTAVRGDLTPNTAGAQATSHPASSACHPATLSTCLMAPPPGSRPWNDPATGPVGTITAQDFVNRYYAADSQTQRDYELQRLTALNLRTVVRENWIASNTDQADVVLLDFGSPAQAQSRALAVEHAAAQNTAKTAVPLTGLPATVVAYATKNLDSDGNIRTIGYGTFDSVELEMFFFSPAQVDTATLTGWLGQESALLAGSS